MVMNRLEAAGNLPENQTPVQQFAIKQARQILENAGVKDPGMPIVSPVEKQTPRIPETPVEVKRFSQDQLILPEAQIPQDVSDILQKAEKAGIHVFDAYHLSDVTLAQDLVVSSWDKKPEQWYWNNIQKGNIASDAPKLPNSWVLIDRTDRPNYNNGRQLHENDPFGPLLKRLRQEKMIQRTRGIPDASRFGISHDELKEVILPEIAKLLDVDSSQVRLPKAIEFNLLGNLYYPKWGEANTWEWFEDNFEGVNRLFGGYSGSGGLTHVYPRWSDHRSGGTAFRPLVVVSPKA